MAIYGNLVNMLDIKGNGISMDRVYINGTLAWLRPYSYTRGTLPTGVASISAEINYSVELYGERSLATTDTIYSDEYISITATPSTGYNNPTIGTLPNPISANVTGANYVTAGSVKSYSFAVPEITGVGKQTLNRTSSPLAGATTGVIFDAVASGSTSITVYYGDVITVTAEPTTGYNNPTISGSPVTISGNVSTSSYITAGSASTQNVTITGTSDWMDGAAIYTPGTRTCTSTFVATAATFAGKRNNVTRGVSYNVKKGSTTVKSGSASSFTMTSGELSSISGTGTITVNCTSVPSTTYWYSARLTVTYTGT